MPKGCGRWDCPYCGQRKKAKLLDRLTRYFMACPNEARFLTLTLGDNFDDEKITEAWNRLRASLRKYGIRLAYLWVKEFTLRGRRHMHVIIDKWVPAVLLRKLWKKATLGTSWRITINRRPLRSAAGYLSKYVTKDVQNETRYKHRERRYSFSQHFNLPKKAKSQEWAFEMDYALYEASQRAGLKTALQLWNTLRDSKNQNRHTEVT